MEVIKQAQQLISGALSIKDIGSVAEDAKLLKSAIRALEREKLPAEAIAIKLGLSKISFERLRRKLKMGAKKAPYKGFQTGLTVRNARWLRKNHKIFENQKSAEILGISKTTLTRWLRVLGIQAKPGTPFKNTYSRAKRGRRADIGKDYFRSSWEANYARYLNYLKREGIIYDWLYESETFWFEKIKRGVRSYTPDFKVWPVAGQSAYFVEVKGWMDAKSATKLKRMRIYHPHIEIRLVFKKEYQELVKAWGHLLYGWEK